MKNKIELAGYLGMTDKEFTEASKTDFKETVKSIENCRRSAVKMKNMLKIAKISYKELGDVLDIPTSNVSRRIHKPDLWEFGLLSKAITYIYSKWPYK